MKNNLVGWLLITKAIPTFATLFSFGFLGFIFRRTLFQLFGGLPKKKRWRTLTGETNDNSGKGF